MLRICFASSRVREDLADLLQDIKLLAKEVNL
jgi:hypothetical protein